MFESNLLSERARKQYMKNKSEIDFQVSSLELSVVIPSVTLTSRRKKFKTFNAVTIF